LAAVGVIVGLVLAAVGSAGASPTTGPAIVPESPADGAVLPAGDEAIPVAFSCPVFAYEEGELIETITEENEEEEIEIVEEIFGPPALGSAENYGIHYSVSSAVGAGGQLGTTGFEEPGEGEAEYVKGTVGQCTSEIELPKKPLPASFYEGRIYWQVYRESAIAADEVEVGPVRSIVVMPHVEEAELSFREQVFAGYLTKVTLTYEAELLGTTVQLQELEGGAWKTIAEQPGNNDGENAFFVKLPKAGRKVLRGLVIGGGGSKEIGLEAVAKAVRKPTKARTTSAGDDGSYVAANKKEQEESPIEFKVSGGGTKLHNLNLEVETSCKGPTPAQDVTIEFDAHLGSAKIAPDGTITGFAVSKGTEAWTVTLNGSLFEGRFQGEATTSYATCSGSRTIDAVLKKPTKK
jgi:hypothetical protein